MYLLFFLMWIIFNGKVTLEIVLFGVVIAAAVFWFVCKFMEHSIRKEFLFYRCIGWTVCYLGVLVWEIFKANLVMTRIILSRKRKVEPVLVHFTTDLKSRTAKVLLANSITLTPGTITASLEGQELTVHCLDQSMAVGVEDSVFVRRLRKLEEMESGFMGGKA